MSVKYFFNRRVFALVMLAVVSAMGFTGMTARAQAPECQLTYNDAISFQNIDVNPITCAFEGSLGDRLEIITPQDLYDLYTPAGELIEPGEDGTITLPASGVYRLDVVLDEIAGEGEAALESITYSGEIVLNSVTDNSSGAAVPSDDLSVVVDGVLERVNVATYRRPRGLSMSQSSANFCQEGFVTVVLTLNELFVRDPEEAEANTFVGSDETEIYFGIASGTPPANISFGSQSAGVISGTYGQDARIADPGFFVRELSCDQVGYVFIRAFERDSFLGTTYTILGAPLFVPLVSQVNSGSVFNPRTEAVFAGNANDGDYDYRIFFTVEFYPGAVADTILPPTARRSPFDEGLRQWATFAEASSEYASPSWGALQATGAPDTDVCGDRPTAWASQTAGGQDTLAVFFDLPVIPTQINIYQTFGQGSIIRVDVIPANGGDPIPLPDSANPPGSTPCPGVFSLNVTTVQIPILGVVIQLDQTIGGTWNEIDAVELVGVG